MRLSTISLANNLAKQFQGIGVQGLCNGKELGHVYLPLVAFDHAHDRVRPFEKRGQIALGEIFLFACFSEHCGHGC